MKFEMMVKKTFHAVQLLAEMQVRYWEDGMVNGVEDVDGELIPLRDGDMWRLAIDLETGYVENWPTGTTAKVHYKVCDAGVYTLVDEDGTLITDRNGYVPNMLGPNGYGDYVILEIDEDGMIQNWNPDLSYFEDDN